MLGNDQKLSEAAGHSYKIQLTGLRNRLHDRGKRKEGENRRRKKEGGSRLLTLVTGVTIETFVK